MILDVETLLLFLGLGAIVGYLAGLFGVGGGGMLVPALVAIFLMNGIAQEKVMHLALGTSMMCMVATTFMSFRAHHARGGVEWGIYWKMIGGVMLGTFLSTFVSSHLNTHYLALFFTLLMGFVALRMFLDVKPNPNAKVPGFLGLFSVGGIIGAISAMMSVGGGGFTVPFLVSRNIEIKKATGTSAAIGFPLVVSGTIGYMINGWSATDLEALTIGYVYIPAVLLISISSAITVRFGVKTAYLLPSKTLKKLFSLLLVGLSIKMLISLV